QHKVATSRSLDGAVPDVERQHVSEQHYIGFDRRIASGAQRQFDLAAFDPVVKSCHLICGAAIHAAARTEIAMYFVDGFRAGGLMQSVNILRDNGGGLALSFESSDEGVGRGRVGAMHIWQSLQRGAIERRPRAA